jgi:ubiquinol-cytochrome c reductase cytochrome c subunit
MNLRIYGLTNWAIAAAVLAAMASTAVAGQTAAPAAPAAAAAAAPAGNAETGQKLWMSIGCYQCHNLQAQGSSATGPRLGPKPIAWAAFTRYVRRPTNQMPPYTAKVVSDADLAHIYAFIQSRPAPTPAQNIPLLSGK